MVVSLSFGWCLWLLFFIVFLSCWCTYLTVYSSPSWKSQSGASDMPWRRMSYILTVVSLVRGVWLFSRRLKRPPASPLLSPLGCQSLGLFLRLSACGGLWLEVLWKGWNMWLMKCKKVFLFVLFSFSFTLFKAYCFIFCPQKWNASSTLQSLCVKSNQQCQILLKSSALKVTLSVIIIYFHRLTCDLTNSPQLQLTQQVNCR